MPLQRMGAVQWLLVLLGIGAAVIVAGLIVWWGAIRESLMDPAVPYQTYTPPPAPEYDDARSWALLPSPDLVGEADIFFVHPTTYSGRQWNAPIGDPKADALLADTMIPNYAGPFAKIGRVFAPRYRQASLYTLMTLREDAREARAFAYGDVLRAFQFFVEHYNQGRPIVLVGVEQGGLLVDRLAREAVAVDPALKARLAAVYLIETPVAAADYGPGAPLPACVRRDQAGCVAAWVAEGFNEQRRTRERLRHAPVWQGGELVHLAGRQPLCFNPLLGAVTDAPATEKANLGGANASGLEWGVRPGFQKHQVSARCEDGILHISRPHSPSLRHGRSWIEEQRVHPYNVFYADIEADAEARLAALMKVPQAPKS